MKITSASPCNGYLPEDKVSGELSRLRDITHLFQSLEPGYFLNLLWRFKHPRFDSTGIEANRWGFRQREQAGLLPHGTIWFASLYEREMIMSILQDNIPYTSIKTARWDEKIGRFTDGQIVRGWRPTLEILTQAGFLKPSKELSCWLGRDSFQICPRHFWM